MHRALANPPTSRYTGLLARNFTVPWFFPLPNSGKRTTVRSPLSPSWRAALLFLPSLLSLFANVKIHSLFRRRGSFSAVCSGKADVQSTGGRERGKEGGRVGDDDEARAAAADDVDARPCRRRCGEESTNADRLSGKAVPREGGPGSGTAAGMQRLQFPGRMQLQSLLTCQTSRTGQETCG